MRMNRKLTQQEIELINTALSDEQNKSGLDIEKYLSQIETLRVVEECNCGDPE